MSKSSFAVMMEETLALKKYEFFKHVSNEVQVLLLNCEVTGKKITRELRAELKLNGYETKLLIPHFDDEAFLEHLQNAMLARSKRGYDFDVPVTYDEYVATDGANELLKRFLALKAVQK